jgi:hypothetical protein
VKFYKFRKAGVDGFDCVKIYQGKYLHGTSLNISAWITIYLVIALAKGKSKNNQG